ncbi:MAG: ATP-binding cassette domain-containing protein, partial [Thermomicrobium sp.]|nr:ATP-binding cassette domain-containing protein [Thermomicrobium sp.]
MTPLLELRNVSASYSGARVIQDVSFEVIAGETLGVIGRNGAGKTTTLLSIFGVPPTVEGTILVEGRELSRKHIYEAASRGVSLVPQGKRIFPNLTVRENLEVGRASGRQSPWGLDEIMELFPNLAPALD